MDWMFIIIVKNVKVKYYVNKWSLVSFYEIL